MRNRQAGRLSSSFRLDPKGSPLAKVSLADEGANAAEQGRMVFVCRMEEPSKGASVVSGRAGGTALPWIAEQIEAVEAAGWQLLQAGDANVYIFRRSA